MIIVDKGESPLILCLPDSGTTIPPAVSKRLNATGRLQTDVSWRLEQVLDLNGETGATVIRSTASRYVIDVDHAPEPVLEPGSEALPALCPLKTLDGKEFYVPDEEPGPTEIEQRGLLFYDPFHDALRREVERLRKQHDRIVVLICRSIRSRIKGFIDEPLPVFSLGTLDGKACDLALVTAFSNALNGNNDMTVEVKDVYPNSYILETYGRPDIGVNAMTVLLAQRTYLRHESPPFEPDRKGIARMKDLFGVVSAQIIAWNNGEAPALLEEEIAQPEQEEAAAAVSD